MKVIHVLTNHSDTTEGSNMNCKSVLLPSLPSSMACQDSSHYLCVPPGIFLFKYNFLKILLSLPSFSFLYASLCQLQINIVKTNPTVRCTFKKPWSQYIKAKNIIKRKGKYSLETVLPMLTGHIFILKIYTAVILECCRGTVSIKFPGTDPQICHQVTCVRSYVLPLDKKGKHLSWPPLLSLLRFIELRDERIPSKSN